MDITDLITWIVYAGVLIVIIATFVKMILKILEQ